MNILKDALCNFELSSNYITFDKEYTHKELLNIYGELSSAIMDCKIPFSKPIGFLTGRMLGKDICPIQYQSRFSMSPVEFGIRLGEIITNEVSGSIRADSIYGKLRKESEQSLKELSSTQGQYINDNVEESIAARMGMLDLKNNMVYKMKLIDGYFGDRELDTLLEKHNCDWDDYKMTNEQYEAAVMTRAKIVPLDSNNLYWASLAAGSMMSNHLDREGVVIPKYLTPFNITNYHYGTSTNVILSIITLKDTGTREYSDNKELFSYAHKDRIMPCRTVYSLTPYIRLWYPTDGGSSMKVTIRRDVDKDVLHRILSEFGGSLC